MCCFGQNLFDPVGKRIITKTGDTEDPLCGPESMKRQYLKLWLVADMDRCEERGGQNQRSHVFQPLVRHYSDVFQVVTLLDESDGLLHSPAGQIGLYHPPEDLPITLHRLSGEKHQRSLPETLDHHQPQLLLGMLGKPHRKEASCNEFSAIFSGR